ncbi:MAG: nitroreductase family protein [Micromonosporaceae bacterium]
MVGAVVAAGLRGRGADAAGGVWKQFMWKYRIARAYRFAFVECGAFMQTALTVATGLGVSAFQTPAIDDAAFCDLLGVEDVDLGPIYMAAFGRTGSRR